MARSPDEIDFEQYYEDWRHRDTLTWQIPAVTVAIGGGIIIGSHAAIIPWHVKALAFALGAFFTATLTVMLAQNLYYQWRDEKHLENYGEGKAKPKSRPIPFAAPEEEEKKSFFNKLGRILGYQRLGSTLLLFTCFSFYVGLSYLFTVTWHLGSELYLLGICVLVLTFFSTFGWFLIWLRRI